jgi:hypothetical protein
MDDNTWQLCPKCLGEKTVPSTPYTYTGVVFGGQRPCPICSGKGIISTITGLPPGLSVEEQINDTKKFVNQKPE